MTALNEQWQAARRLRQQEVVDRRHQVFADLERCQTHRLAHAVQLRQNLNQTIADLQVETHHWLIEAAQQRQAKIPALRQSLQAYTQTLQIDTQILLDAFQTEREVQAVAVRQKLEQDCQALRLAVSDLRLDIAQALQQVQRQVEAIHQATAVDLAGYRQQQATVRAKLLPQLTAYVEALQADVQSALAAMTEVRQQAAAIHRSQRQIERQALTQSVNVMFDQLIEFRQALTAYRTALTTMVWGTAHAPAGVTVQSPVQPNPRSIAKSSPQPAVAKPPRATPGGNGKAAKAVVKPVAPAVPAAPNPPVVAEPVMRKPVAPEPAASEPLAPKMTIAVVEPPLPSPHSLEEVVYNYLHLAQGAGLAEIESELDINRFQSVDALRSLIQKDLVVKQDRTYYVQEEAIL